MILPGGRAAAIAAALAVVYVVWGSTYLGIAVAIETMPPLLMSAVRYLIAGGILYAIARRLGGAPAPRRADWWPAAIAGGALFVIGNGGVAVAEETVPSGIVALLVATTPLWMTLMDRVAFGVRLAPVAIGGLVIGFAGVALLVNPTVPGRLDPFGSVVTLVAAFGWAAGSMYARGGRLPEHALLSAAMQMVAGGVLLGIAGVARGELSHVDLGAISTRSIVALVYLITIGALVAFTAYAWLLQNARTSVVSTYAYVNPVIAVVLGWAILSEPIGARTVLAGAAIVLAVALIVSPRRKREQLPGAVPAPQRAG